MMLYWISWLGRMSDQWHIWLHFCLQINDIYSMCEGLGEYTLLELYCSTRWLSLFDVSVDVLRQIDGLTLFYYGFLPKDDQTTYLARIAEIKRRRNINSQAQSEALREVWEKCKIKKMGRTEDGKKRLEKILDGKYCEKRNIWTNLKRNIWT